MYMKNLLIKVILSTDLEIRSGIGLKMFPKGLLHRTILELQFIDMLSWLTAYIADPGELGRCEFVIGFDQMNIQQLRDFAANECQLVGFQW